MWISRKEYAALNAELKRLNEQSDAVLKRLAEVLAEVRTVSPHFRVGGSQWMPPALDEEPTK